MRLFKRNKTPEDRALTAANVPEVMLASTHSGARVTPATALTIGDAWACIRALSDAAASLPLIAYRRTPEGRQRLDSGSLVDLLDRPAPAVTQANLIGQVMAHLNLWGNAFLGKFRNAEGRIEQLALLAPDRVRVELKGGLPLYVLRDEQGREATLTTSDVLHIRGLSTDGVVGLSPVRQAREALGLSAKLTEHAARFFTNDARPSGVLSLPDARNRESVDHALAVWNAGHKGVEHAHRIAVMSGNITFTPLSMPLEDAQFLEQRKLSATETARVFRVPPWMIGADAGSSMTYANVEQQALRFVTYSLRPWLVAIEQAISADTDLCTRNVYVEFLVDALLRADSDTRAQIYTRALDPVTGWLTRAEVRRLENLPPEHEEAPEVIPPTTSASETADA